MIKLIAIDLDGTLFNNKKEITERNKAAITKAKEQGVKVVICTGRPLKAIVHIIQELGLDEDGDYAITFNGGLAQRNHSGEILDQKTMDIDTARKVVAFLAENDLPATLIHDSNAYEIAAANPSLYRKGNIRLTFHDIEASEIRDDMICNKIVTAVEAKILDAKIASFPKDALPEVEMVKSQEFLLEFLPKGVSKAYGLGKLCDYLGIDASEVMAIGDEANDLPMIEYAGVGVAMKNAVDEVKAIAQVITDDNEHDGVAKIIEKMVLGG